MGSCCTETETTEICEYCLALERGRWRSEGSEPQRGKSLRLLKVITSGSGVVAHICNYHARLSLDEGLVIVMLIIFYLRSDSAVFIISESLCKSNLPSKRSILLLILSDHCALRSQCLLAGIFDT